ncbi:patatin-like phospholipase family protein [Thiocapsa rosea]|uniref:Patatin-like phospholipase n=1 Tax=Thiocapsa rosea TaxID=69360 RepID=A0A495ULD3_9GAMM|nr:patatin-like phospholipase family protein [Thiocapsa rosea]RKT37879.1 patatin-like phospholipase [Thiocapsa rosea]
MNLAETLGLRPKPYRILTIDGGGVRGIIPVLWIDRLERYLNGPVHAHCDLIAGTSVGAILGCGFAMGMTATQAREMWLNGAHVAFSKPHSMKERGRRIAARAGLMAKYESAGLEALLRSIFRDTRMGDLTPPTLALSYDIQSMQVHVFSSAKEEHKDLRVWEVCRASTAAPLFWDPHLMALDDSGVRHPMADGGMTANNPVVLAISESVSHAKGTGRAVPLENVVVASFGTGAPPEGQTQIPKTIFGHGSMIMRALMTGATGTDHVTARTMLPAKNYWRFQTSISGRLAPLDDIENIDELQAVAMAHLADGADQRLGQLARRLQGKPLDRRWWEGSTEEAVA